jgi:hypothetical protein
MTVDEMLCRWAEKKYDVPEVSKVEMIFDEGWGGTEVTPGDPPTFDIRVTGPGYDRLHGDLEYVPELIREVLEFALASRDKDAK